MPDLTPEQRLLAFDALEKWAKDQKEKIKHQVQDTMLDDYKNAGIEKRAIKHPATGERIGSWLVPVPKPAPKIIDPDALLDWLLSYRPDLTETVIVKDAHKKLAADCAKGDDGELYDPETGEAVPGVKIDVGTPTYIRASYEGGKARQELIVKEALEGRYPLMIEAAA